MLWQLLFLLYLKDKGDCNEFGCSQGHFHRDGIFVDGRAVRGASPRSRQEGFFPGITSRCRLLSVPPCRLCSRTISSTERIRAISSTTICLRNIFARCRKLFRQGVSVPPAVFAGRHVAQSPKRADEMRMIAEDMLFYASGLFS